MQIVDDRVTTSALARSSLATHPTCHVAWRTPYPAPIPIRTHAGRRGVALLKLQPEYASQRNSPLRTCRPPPTLTANSPGARGPPQRAPPGPYPQRR